MSRYPGDSDLFSMGYEDEIKEAIFTNLPYFREEV